MNYFRQLGAVKASAVIILGLVASLIALLWLKVGSASATPNPDWRTWRDAHVERTSRLPDESLKGLEVLTAQTVFDLSDWKPVPEGQVGERISPAYISDFLYVKKVAQVEHIVLHYATTGAGIDLWCLSHPFQVWTRNVTTGHGQGESMEYAMSIDISGVPVGVDFAIVVVGTNWNGFANGTSESASTYTNQVVERDRLSLSIVFPESKRPKSKNHFELRAYDDAGVVVRYKDASDLKYDMSSGWAFWDIQERRPNTHYTLVWNWAEE